MSQDLKPCPFCGSTDISTENARDFVMCLGCKTEGPVAIGMGSAHNIEAWNARTEMAQQPMQLVAWKSKTAAYKAFITQDQYLKIGPTHQRWYEPFKCASCAAPKQATPARVYIVATGETHNAQETYTRHDGAPPPLSDAERLFTSPVLQRAASSPVVAQQQPRSPDVRAAMLFALWHHQGGSSNIGQPIRAALGIGPHAPLTKDQIEEARRVQSAFSAQQAVTAQSIARPDQPLTKAVVQEMLRDTREVFDSDGLDTPEIVHDVIEYVASWLAVYADKSTDGVTVAPTNGGAA